MTPWRRAGSIRSPDISNIHKPIEGVTMENVTITGAKDPMRFNHIQALTLNNVTCNGSSEQTILLTNCTGVVRSGAVTGTVPPAAVPPPER
jgi:hypothetical protein